MISIGKTSSVEQAVRYLLEAQADALIDYMAGRGEAPGRWGGRGAAVLGLRGEITEEALRAVLNGRHPATGDELGRHWGSQRVVAFDVTFSCPKSVSLLYALGDAATRDAVLQAQARAVDAVTEYLQAHAGWARQYDAANKCIEHVRADLVMASFVHRTARPVTDPDTKVTTIDPQLHTHVVIPTWVSRPDGSWGQLYSEPLYQHAAPAGALGQAVLRDELVRELGIAVEVLPNGCFEVVGISQEQRDEFSRRTLQIEAMEEAQGVDSFRGHKIAVTGSRQSKQEVEPGVDVFAEWRRRADEVGLSDHVVAGLFHREERTHDPRALDVPNVDAIVGSRGLTAERSTFARRDLVRAVATHAPLGMSRRQIEATVDNIVAHADQVVALTSPPDGSPDAAASPPCTDPGMEARHSTREMVAIEREMLATALARRGAGVGVANDGAIRHALEKRPMLTEGQREMIEKVCRSGDGVVLVEGAAGVGKSLALDACRDAFEGSGVVVVGCAVAGRAADELQEASGIRSFTLAGTLAHLRNHRLVADSVLVVDEAGMAGSRDLAELVDIAARDGAKLVAVGDPAQLQPVDAGAPFRVLGDRLGCIQLTQNVRQDEVWEREVLQALRTGDAVTAARSYLDHDRVRSTRNAWDRRTQIVADYIATDATGADVVMLARRREDVAELNALARDAADAGGRLQGPALMVGERSYRVGDKVLCLENRRRPITNGLRGEVVAIDEVSGVLTMRATGGRTVRVDTTTYDAIDHAYALTVHKAQGLTADIGLVLGSEAATKEWAYTALSRGRMATRYYTIDHPPVRDEEGIMHWSDEQRTLEERLARAWARSEAKDTTLDYQLGCDRGIDERRQASETVDRGRPGPATDRQRAVLDALGAPGLDAEASWVRASIEIDRHSGTPLGAHAVRWLEETGLDPGTARDLVVDAIAEAGTGSRPPSVGASVPVEAGGTDGMDAFVRGTPSGETPKGLGGTTPLAADASPEVDEVVLDDVLWDLGL